MCFSSQLTLGLQSACLSEAEFQGFQKLFWMDSTCAILSGAHEYRGRTLAGTYAFVNVSLVKPKHLRLRAEMPQSPSGRIETRHGGVPVFLKKKKILDSSEHQKVLKKILFVHFQKGDLALLTLLTLKALRVHNEFGSVERRKWHSLTQGIRRFVSWLKPPLLPVGTGGIANCGCVDFLSQRLDGISL